MIENFEDENLRKKKRSVRLLEDDTPQIQNVEDNSEEKPLLGSKKLPFPKSVFFIFLNEFCERYSFYGLEAILALFLRNILNYTETASTVIYHLFVTLSYTTPLFGGIFADSVFGKFTTTVYFSVVHSIGSAALAIGALPFLSITLGTLVTILALIVTAIGIGGIKPSVAAFGGDQFKLPEQNDQLTIYFSIYYLSINVGAALSEIFTPILRKDINCFGQDTCYSLAFAVPAILMVFSLVAFVLGKRMYKMKPVTESVTVNTLNCIFYAIGNRREKREVDHWLDYASDKYSLAFINDIKALFRVLVLFSPLVIFWSLWTQMGTTWTFQATRMNGYLSDTFTLKPDQLQVTNSILILFLIPIFDTAIYPLLAKCNCLVKAIHRISVGCFFMSISFVVAGCLELQLQNSYPRIPSNVETSFIIINGLPCQLNISIDPVFVENQLSTVSSDLSSYSDTLEEYENSLFEQIPAVDYNITITHLHHTYCIINGTEVTFSPTEFLPQPGQVQTFLITNNTAGEGVIIPSRTQESLPKSDEANAKCRIISDVTEYKQYTIELTSSINSNYSSQFSLKNQETLNFEVEPGIYNVKLRGTANNVTNHVMLGTIELLTGGSYLLGVFQNPNSRVITAHLYILTNPNVIHMLWQLPQYAILTLAEILVAVTGYHFAYDQAPLSMKSTLQSVWLMTVAGGNLIIVFIVAFDLFPTQAILFFFFAGFMLVGTWMFMFLGYRYQPHIHDEYEVEHSGLPTPPSNLRRRLRRQQSFVETAATGVK